MERDIPDETGSYVSQLRGAAAWMAAYAAATGTTASWEKIRDAATPDETNKTGRKTTVRYREALAGLFLLDDLPAWLPFGSKPKELGQAPKHHLADPALAARLLGDPRPSS